MSFGHEVRAGDVRRSAKDGTDAPAAKDRAGIVGVLICLAMFGAVIQNPLIASRPGTPGANAIDDGAVALLAFAAILQARRLGPSIALALALWITCIMGGILYAVIPLEQSLIPARQIFVPMLLVLVGVCLNSAQWEIVSRMAIAIGLANAIYGYVELLGFHPFDPAKITSFNVAQTDLRDGLPGYYYYYVGEFGDYLERVGGLPLNPPVAGIVIGTAFALASYQRKGTRRVVLLGLMSMPLVMTFSRAGWLIAIAGALVPRMVARLGATTTAAVVLPVAFLAGLKLSEDGESSVHAEGFASSFSLATHGFFGSGFGSFGNYAKSLNLTEASESLLGIAFASCGIMSIVIVAILLGTLWSRLIRQPGNYIAGLSLGALVAAALSESAGALNGTIPLWIAVGVAVIPASRTASQSLASEQPVQDT